MRCLASQTRVRAGARDRDYPVFPAVYLQGFFGDAANERVVRRFQGRRTSELDGNTERDRNGVCRILENRAISCGRWNMSQIPKTVRRARTRAEVLGWFIYVMAVLSIATGNPQTADFAFFVWMAAVLFTATEKPTSTRFDRTARVAAAPFWPVQRVVRLTSRISGREKPKLHGRVEEMDGMTGEEFEAQLGVLFRKQGYAVELTPRSGDFGADLVLTRGPDKTVVQAKRYSKAVGVEAVQEVIGAIAYYGAHHGLVVTTNYFTPSAVELAQRSRVILWDRDALARALSAADALAEHGLGRNTAGTVD